MQETLHLSDTTFLAAGNRRQCHIHPHDTDVCIKIPLRRRGVWDCRREVSYMKKIKNRRYFNSYSKFLCTVSTNKGTGYAFELVRDAPSAAVSRSLDLVYIDSLFLNIGPSKDVLDEKIRELCSRLDEGRILTTDLFPKNIAVQHKVGGDFDLIIFDGIGRGRSVPLLDRLRLVTKRRVKKCYERKLQSTIDEYLKIREHLTSSGCDLPLRGNAHIHHRRD